MSSSGETVSPRKDMPVLGGSVLVDPPGQEGHKEPVFYPEDLDLIDSDEDLPPPPSKPNVADVGRRPVASQRKDESDLPSPLSMPNGTRAGEPPVASLARNETAPVAPPTKHESPPVAPPSQNASELPELPEAPPSRLIGQGYSASHPVPTVQAYKSEQATHEEEARHYAELVERRRQEAEERDQQAATHAPGNVSETKQVAGEETNVAKTQRDKTDKPSAGTGATEKSKMMDQMNANKRESIEKTQLSSVKPTDRFKKAEKGERRVRDPITGTEIIVKDSDPKGA